MATMKVKLWKNDYGMFNQQIKNSFGKYQDEPLTIYLSYNFSKKIQQPQCEKNIDIIVNNFFFNCYEKKTGEKCVSVMVTDYEVVAVDGEMVEGYEPVSANTQQQDSFLDDTPRFDIVDDDLQF